MSYVRKSLTGEDWLKGVNVTTYETLADEWENIIARKIATGE